MAEANNLENRTEEEIRKANNRRHLKRVMLGMIAFVAFAGAGWGVATYFYITTSHEYKTKQGYEYCQQIKSAALEFGRECHLERAYPPNSNYNCLEIGQQYKELNKE